MLMLKMPEGDVLHTGGDFLLYFFAQSLEETTLRIRHSAVHLSCGTG